MFIVGLILFVIGLIFSGQISYWLWVIGIILMVIGAVFWLLGRAGRAVGGRRYWY